MTYIELLTKQALRTSIQPDGRIRIEPDWLITGDIRQMIRENRDEVVREIREHAIATDASIGIVPDYSFLMVATNLDSWIADDPRIGYEVMLDTCYRQLDGSYYAWLRHRMENARAAHKVGNLDDPTFNTLREQFNAIHNWAVEHIGEDALKQAIRTTNVRRYIQPSEATFAVYRRNLDEAWRSRCQPTTVSVPATTLDRMIAVRGYAAIHSAIIDDIVVIVRDDTIVLPDACASKVRFTLEELGLIVGSSREMVKQLCDVKKVFGGDVVPSENYPFDETAKTTPRSLDKKPSEHQQSLFAA